MPNVVVYIRSADWRSLEAEGDPAEWVRSVVARELEGRGGVIPGADPAGVVPPRPSSSTITDTPLDGAAAGAEDTPSAAPSSGGSSSRAPSGTPRRSKPGAEPVGAGPLSEGEEGNGTPESAPSPAGASQGGARPRRPRSGKCPHGVAAGSYCKRCKA